MIIVCNLHSSVLEQKGKSYLVTIYPALPMSSFDAIQSAVSLVVRHCKDAIYYCWHRYSALGTREYVLRTIIFFRNVFSSRAVGDGEDGSLLSVVKKVQKVSTSGGSADALSHSVVKEVQKVSTSGGSADAFSYFVVKEVQKVSTSGGSADALSHSVVEEVRNVRTSGGSADATSDSFVKVVRKPENLYYLDHRGCLEGSTRTFYCDICWKPSKHGGDQMPYWGGYTNKTWNNDGDVSRVTRAALYEGWNDGTYDLSWHCVPCHAESIGSVDHRQVAYDLGVFRFAPKRCKRKEQRHKDGHW